MEAANRVGMTTPLLPYNAAMRVRSARLVFGTLVMIALAGCAPPPKLGAPPGSFAKAAFRVGVAGAEEFVLGAAVTAQFFAAEGVRPALGRLFTEGDFAPGEYGVAILSDRYWTERLRSDPAVIGTKIVVDGRQRVIVGVTPPEFQPEGAGLVWIPKRP
jgi:MacB-like periplasmic core domain